MPVIDMGFVGSVLFNRVPIFVRHFFFLPLTLSNELINSIFFGFV